MSVLGWMIEFAYISLILLGILAALICVYITYMKWHFGDFKKMGIQGPSPKLLTGTFIEMKDLGFEKAQMLWVEKYGKVYGTFDGRRPVLNTIDQDMMREILVKQFQNFCDRSDVMGSLLGDMKYAVSLLKGEHWKNVRHLMSPLFSSGKLKKLTPFINKAADSLVDHITESIQRDPQLDMKRLYSGYTMDVIASTAFGIEVNSIKNPDDPFIHHGSRLTSKDFKEPIFALCAVFPFLEKFFAFLGYSMFGKESQKFFRKTVIETINNRSAHRKDFVDFLQLMMDVYDDDEADKSGKKKGLTSEEILSNCLVFFLAGYENSASVLTLLTYEVAKNPEIQDKLVKEVEDVLGDSKPDCSNIGNLVYLDMCLNEIQRVYPLITRLDRLCNQDSTVGKYRIPKGMIVSVAVYALHHSKELWADPEKFDPERFSPENKAKQSPFQFIPFGYGPRLCLGMRLALLKAKIAFASVIKEFRFSEGEKTKLPESMGKNLQMTPSELWLSVQLRT